MEIEMKTVQKKEEKLSYEQLENVARDLTMQRNQLVSQLQSARRVISEFNDLGMLLSIIDKSEYFHSAFIDRCTAKIEYLVSRALDNAEKAEREASAADNTVGA